MTRTREINFSTGERCVKTAILNHHRAKSRYTLCSLYVLARDAQYARIIVVETESVKCVRHVAAICVACYIAQAEKADR